MTFDGPNLPVGPRSAAINTRRRAPLSEMYRVFSSGLSTSPLGLFAVVIKRNDKPLEIDQENPLEIELARLVADITGIGDVNTSPPVDGDVVGAIEPLIVVVVGQGADRAVALGDRDPPAAAGVGPLGDDQPAALNRKSCRWPARWARETPWSCRSWGQTA